jgi:hypothetical protein
MTAAEIILYFVVEPTLVALTAYGIARVLE